MMTENAESGQVGLRFWLLWVLATTVGYVVVEIVGDALGPWWAPLGDAWGPWIAPLGGSFTGALIGIAQWIVLRRHVSRAGWWVLASALGGLVAGFLIIGGF